MHDFLSLARLSRGQVLDVWSVVSAERMVLRPRHYTGHALQNLFLPVAAQCDLLAGAVLQRGCERADVKTILFFFVAEIVCRQRGLHQGHPGSPH